MATGERQHRREPVHQIRRKHEIAQTQRREEDLTLAIATINAWNRLSIAAGLTPGTYQPADATAD